MKKIAMLLAFALLATAAHAEKVVGKFIMAGQEKTVEADITDEGKLIVYFDVLGENDWDKVMMSVTGDSDICAFIEKLQYCKSKFIEWKQVARDNDIVDFKKRFDVTFPNVELWWKGYDDWYSSLSEDYMKPLFNVSDDGDVAFIAGGTVEDWDNMFVDQKWLIVICNESEFDSLINALDPVRIRSKLASDVERDNLFQ